MKPNGTLLILAIMALAAASFSARAEAQRGTPLKSGEIRKALAGKMISYNPPGWADTGMSEEFHPNGVWKGTLYGVGIIPFSGRWSISDNQICVTADKGSFAERWHSGLYCRKVWRDQPTGTVQIEYLGDQTSSRNKFGLQATKVSDLATTKKGL